MQYTAFREKYILKHFPDFSDQLQDYISLIANSLFLYLATLVQVLNTFAMTSYPAPLPHSAGEFRV